MKKAQADRLIREGNRVTLRSRLWDETFSGVIIRQDRFHLYISHISGSPDNHIGQLDKDDIDLVSIS